jgi:hypothetical protein
MQHDIVFHLFSFKTLDNSPLLHEKAAVAETERFLVMIADIQESHISAGKEPYHTDDPDEIGIRYEIGDTTENNEFYSRDPCFCQFEDPLFTDAER